MPAEVQLMLKEVLHKHCLHGVDSDIRKNVHSLAGLFCLMSTKYVSLQPYLSNKILTAFVSNKH